ncbi:hypothetical protein ACHAWF_017514, partial [Thalassiosira exigua]
QASRFPRRYCRYVVPISPRSKKNDHDEPPRRRRRRPRRTGRAPSFLPRRVVPPRDSRGRRRGPPLRPRPPDPLPLPRRLPRTTPPFAPLGPTAVRPRASPRGERRRRRRRPPPSPHGSTRDRRRQRSGRAVAIDHVRATVGAARSRVRLGGVAGGDLRAEEAAGGRERGRRGRNSGRRRRRGAKRRSSERLAPLAQRLAPLPPRLPLSHARTSALLFVDISGFTKISTTLDVESLSAAINAYFRALVDVVTCHGGDVLKFAGDAIFAEWRADEEEGGDDDEGEGVEESEGGGGEGEGDDERPRSGLGLEECVLAAAECAAAIVATCSDYAVLARPVMIRSRRESMRDSTNSLPAGMRDSTTSVHGGMRDSTTSAHDSVATGSSEHKSEANAVNIPRPPASSATRRGSVDSACSADSSSGAFPNPHLRGTLRRRSSASEPVVLNVKCGVGAGRIVGVHVGDDVSRREFLIVGDPVDQVAKAEGAAKLGEARCSPEAKEVLRRTATLGGGRGGRRRGRGDHSNDLEGEAGGKEEEKEDSEAPFRIADRGRKFFRASPSYLRRLDSVASRPRDPLERLDGLDAAELRWLRTTLALYVHPVVAHDEVDRVAHAGSVAAASSSSEGFSGAATVSSDVAHDRHLAEAELRDVYTCFVTPLVEHKLAGDARKDGAFLRLLDDVMNLVTSELARVRGHLRQFILDDKGLVIICTFGLRGSTFPNMIAQRAVPFGLSIRRALKEELGVACKVGATFGKAYCGIVGGRERHEFAVLGPSVNLAARLTGHVHNPGILVDKNVRLLTSHVFFKPLPAVKAKGYDDPVPIFEPVPTSNPNPVDEGRGRWGRVRKDFVGREEETKRIMRVAKDMGGGGGGSGGGGGRGERRAAKMIFVEAASGTGKSALIVQATEHVRAMMRRMDRRVVVTRNVSNEGDSRIPFSIFRSIFKDVLSQVRQEDEESQASRQRKLVQAVSECPSPSHGGHPASHEGGGGGGNHNDDDDHPSHCSPTSVGSEDSFSIDAEWDSLSINTHSSKSSTVSTDATRFRFVCNELNAPPEFVEVVGKRFLGLRERQPTGPGGVPGAGKKAPDLRKVVDFMADALLRCTRRAKLVLLALDDVQWMDEMSWKVVQAIFERGKNVFVLCGSRPLDSDPLTVDPKFWSDLRGKHREEGRYSEFGLEPFDESKVREMVAASLGLRADEVDGSFGRNVYATSGGMPYYLTYVLDTVKRNKLTTRRDDGTVGLKSSADDEDNKFGSVSELLLYRLDALDAPVRAVLHLAAVLGMEFDLLDAALAYEEMLAVPESKRLETALALRQSLDVAIEEGILEQLLPEYVEDDAYDDIVDPEEAKICASMENLAEGTEGASVLRRELPASVHPRLVEDEHPQGAAGRAEAGDTRARGRVAGAGHGRRGVAARSRRLREADTRVQALEVQRELRQVGPPGPRHREPAHDAGTELAGDLALRRRDRHPPGRDRRRRRVPRRDRRVGPRRRGRLRAGAADQAERVQGEGVQHAGAGPRQRRGVPERAGDPEQHPLGRRRGVRSERVVPHLQRPLLRAQVGSHRARRGVRLREGPVQEVRRASAPERRPRPLRPRPRYGGREPRPAGELRAGAGGSGADQGHLRHRDAARGDLQGLRERSRQLEHGPREDRSGAGDVRLHRGGDRAQERSEERAQHVLSHLYRRGGIERERDGAQGARSLQDQADRTLRGALRRVRLHRLQAPDEAHPHGAGLARERGSGRDWRHRRVPGVGHGREQLGDEADLRSGLWRLRREPKGSARGDLLRPREATRVRRGAGSPPREFDPALGRVRREHLRLAVRPRVREGQARGGEGPREDHLGRFPAPYHDGHLAFGIAKPHPKSIVGQSQRPGADWVPRGAARHGNILRLRIHHSGDAAGGRRETSDGRGPADRVQQVPDHLGRRRAQGRRRRHRRRRRLRFSRRPPHVRVPIPAPGLRPPHRVHVSRQPLPRTRARGPRRHEREHAPRHAQRGDRRVRRRRERLLLWVERAGLPGPPGALRSDEERQRRPRGSSSAGPLEAEAEVDVPRLRRRLRRVRVRLRRRHSRRRSPRRAERQVGRRERPGGRGARRHLRGREAFRERRLPDAERGRVRRVSIGHVPIPGRQAPDASARHEPRLEHGHRQPRADADDEGAVGGGVLASPAPQPGPLREALAGGRSRDRPSFDASDGAHGERRLASSDGEGAATADAEGGVRRLDDDPIGVLASVRPAPRGADPERPALPRREGRFRDGASSLRGAGDDAQRRGRGALHAILGAVRVLESKAVRGIVRRLPRGTERERSFERLVREPVGVSRMRRNDSCTFFVLCVLNSLSLDDKHRFYKLYVIPLAEKMKKMRGVRPSRGGVGQECDIDTRSMERGRGTSDEGYDCSGQERYRLEVPSRPRHMLQENAKLRH